jgi:hypothetical protein
VDALTLYCQAVERGDAEAVYGLLDDSMKMGMDVEGFKAWFARNREGFQEQARDLAAHAREEDVRVEAAVPVVLGQEALLLWEDGEWRMLREVPARGAQRGPRETIESLRRALRDQDMEELLRLMSAERRAALLREMEALLTNLEGSQDNPIVTQGDRADLVLDNGDRVKLVREDGFWRVSNYEQAP